MSWRAAAAVLGICVGLLFAAAWQAYGAGAPGKGTCPGYRKCFDFRRGEIYPGPKRPPVVVRPPAPRR